MARSLFEIGVLALVTHFAFIFIVPWFFLKYLPSVIFLAIN